MYLDLETFLDVYHGDDKVLLPIGLSTRSIMAPDVCQFLEACTHANIEVVTDVNTDSKWAWYPKWLVRAAIEFNKNGYAGLTLKEYIKRLTSP